MDKIRLTRRSVLRTGVLAISPLAAPSVRAACLNEPEYVSFLDEPEDCLGIQNQLVPASLIQSDFRNGDHGNFEAAVLRPAAGSAMDLWHFCRDTSNVYNDWQPGNQGKPIVANVAGPACIIQSDFRSGSHGNFEVVVPLPAAGGTIDLWHFWHDNSDVSRPWERGQRIWANVAGSACIIQSDFRSGSHGNFEVVVPLPAAAGAMDLWHFWHDNSDLNKPWQRGLRVAASVTGAGCIIQSDFRSGAHGNFEVVVPVVAANGKMDLWHFWHDNSDVNKPWQRGQRVAGDVDGSGVLIQSDFRSGGHGNFEVVVSIGNSLVHFWHDNSDVNKPWQRGQNVTDVARGPGCIIQSDFIGTDVPRGGSDCSIDSQGQTEPIANNHGNFEILVPECSQSLVHYWHPNQDVALPWMRGPRLVAGEPDPSRVTGATKVAQLTGEYDRQGWNGLGTPPFALNRTECRFGIRGTDLGASFEHNKRLYFLFGDTWRVNQTDPEEKDLDAVAFTTDTDPSHGVHLTFNKQPPFVFPCINQHGFNVPVDGTSWNDAMYVFFTTDSYPVPSSYPAPTPSDPKSKYSPSLMGRCVLGRSADGGCNFMYLAELSRNKFVNVSVEQGTVYNRVASMLGLKSGTPVLWMWGTGHYRMSSVYLAVLPLADLDTLTNVRYFTGGKTWSSNEDDATALVREGDVGELSVRWNPYLRRWLMLFNSDNPRGILMHSASVPWGSWSTDPVLVFDPWSGYGKFMHISDQWARDHHVQGDHVQDDMFNTGLRNNEWGGEYGPYQISRYAGIAADNTPQIWFMMSTWNPYQSMLMTALIPRRFV